MTGFDAYDTHYKSVTDFCNRNGITQSNFYHFKKVHEYANNKEAAESFIAERQRLVIDGTPYRSARQACLAIDLPYHSVAKYSERKCIDIDDAVKLFAEQKKVRGLVINGLTFLDKNACCDAYGLDLEEVEKFSTYHKLSFEESVIIMHRRAHRLIKI